MVKALGLLDLFVTSLLVAVAFNVEVPSGLIYVLVGFLFFKALPFIKDIGSILDILIVALLVCSVFFAIPQIVFFIGAGLLGLKGIMSLFS